MTHYTVQRLKSSGDALALRRDDDLAITGVSEALNDDDLQTIRNDPSWLASLDYNPDDAAWANATEWQSPLFSY